MTSVEPAIQLDFLRRRLKYNICGPSATGTGYFNERAAHNLLNNAFRDGIPLDVLYRIVGESTSWTKFTNRILKVFEEFN